MCGRTGLSLNKEQVQCACSYKPKSSNLHCKPEWLHEHNDGREYTPSYNIAPTDVTPVIVSASKFKNAAHTDRILKPMMWGIIPPWHKTPAPVKVTGGWIHDYSVLCYDLPGTRNILHKGDYRNHNLSTNNCRLEGIQGSKLYGPVLQDGGRCVIVVEGFYEWQTTIKTGKIKQPYYIFSPQDERIQVDDPETWNMSYSDENGWNGIKLLHMAGLYSIWQHNEVIMYSYSVITMDSNSTLDWLHHRMPAILDSENQVDAWLNITDVDPHMALGYLRPVKILSWHPVSTLVNNSRNKSSDCNKRISINQKNKSTQKTLTGWFVKAEKRKRDDNSDNKQNKKKQC